MEIGAVANQDSVTAFEISLIVRGKRGVTHYVMRWWLYPGTIPVVLKTVFCQVMGIK